MRYFTWIFISCFKNFTSAGWSLAATILQKQLLVWTKHWVWMFFCFVATYSMEVVGRTMSFRNLNLFWVKNNLIPYLVWIYIIHNSNWEDVIFKNRPFYKRQYKKKQKQRKLIGLVSKRHTVIVSKPRKNKFRCTWVITLSLKPYTQRTLGWIQVLPQVESSN